MLAGTVQDWVQTVATVLAALAATVAVVLALWLQVFLTDRRKPVLNMSYRKTIGENLSPTHTAKQIILWVRFLVKNEGGGDTADDAQVRITKVHADGKPLSYALPLRTQAWSDIGKGTLNLPADVSRYVDFVAITCLPDPAALPAMRLIQFPWRSKNPIDDPAEWEERETLGRGQYELEIAVSARSVPARYYRARVAFEPAHVDVPEQLAEQIDVRLTEGKLDES